MERSIVFFRDFLHKLEIDRAVFWGLLTRMWQTIAVPVTALLVAANFTPELQGYYYAFESLIKLQIFVELGLGAVIVQFASHEWSKLGLDKTGKIVGDTVALSRLVSLASISTRWYLVGSVVLIVGLGIGGHLFFSMSYYSGVYWTTPWVVLCVLTGLTVCLLPVWSLLEGCGQVSGVYFYRFLQGLCAYIAIWLAILAGAKLWAASIFSVAGIFCAGIYLYKNYRNFLRILLFSSRNGPPIGWRSEIWPMQWRIAVSWASGYFTFWLFSPVLFYYHGPVVSGQMGMTWSLVSSLLAVTSVWVLPKAPQFGRLIARGEYKELDALFWRLTKVVMGVAVLGAVAIWALVYLLYALKHPMSSRILPPFPTAFFLLATVIITASLPMSVYLRAHKREPLLFLSAVNGVLITISNLILGKHFSAMGMAVGFFLANLLLFPFIVLVWNRCRMAWHITDPGD